MKYYIILKVEVEAAPADYGAAAKKGFSTIANLLNSGNAVRIGIVPIDDSPEAKMAVAVMATCFNAESKANF